MSGTYHQPAMEMRPLVTPSFTSPETSASPPAVWPGTDDNYLPLRPPAASSRMHGDQADASWGVTLARKWAQLRRANWNLICATGLAVFFFLLYMTSPDGRYMSRNAACPVPITDIDYMPPRADHNRHATAPSTAILVPCPVCPACPQPAAPSSAPMTAAAAADAALASAWSSGRTLPTILRSASTPLQLSSHKGSKVRKRVHIKHSVVPNLLQFAESTFEPGDEAERHQHETATEVFYVRRGVLSIFFDADGDAVDSEPLPLHANGTAITGAATAPSGSQRFILHELREHDSVTIPPKRWHRMANLHDETLELVYFTLLTP